MKIVISNTTKGAYEGVLAELKTKLFSGQSCVLLTTDRMTATVEKAVLSSIEKEGIVSAFDLTVTSFTRLAANLLGDSVAKCLTPEGSVMLLASVVEDVRGDLKYYKKAHTDGFASELYAALTAIRNSGVSSSDLAESAEKLNGSLKDKALDLSLIYSGYLSALGEKRSDSSTRLEALAAYLETCAPLSDNYYVIDFLEYNAPQLAVLKGLALKAKTLTVGAVSGYRNPNARIYPERALSALYAVADGKPQKSYYNEELDEVRDAAGKYLFSYEKPSTLVDCKGRVELKAALNRRDEVLALALDIINNVRAGARYRDFEVLLSSCEAYSPLVVSTFTRYGIPFFIDQKELLAEQTKVRYLTAAIRAVSGGFKREDVLELVKNPLFINSLDVDCLSGEDIEADDEDSFENDLKREDAVFKFENYVLAYSVNYGSFFKEFTYGECEIAEKVRRSFALAVAPLDLKGVQPVENFTSGCRQFLDNCETAWRAHVDKLSKMSAYYRKCAEQVDDKIKSVLDEIDGVLHSSYDVKQFENVLKSMLKTLKIALVPTFLDCVFIGDIDSRFTGGNGFYILGANSGMFPSDKVGGAVITPKDEEMLAEIGVEIYPDERSKIRSELFAITEIIKKARGKLTVSYAESSPSGLLRPSTVIAQLQAVLSDGGAPLEVTRINFKDYYRRGTDDKKELLSLLFSTRKACFHEVLSAAAGGYAPEDADVYRSAYAALKASDGDGKYIERIFRIYDVPERLSHDMSVDKTSISRLETYFKCPYLYYLSYVLGLKPREEGELKSLDNGIIMHRVLEEFFRALKDGKVSADNASKIAARAFDKCIEEDGRLKMLMAQPDTSRLLLRLKAECEKTCADLYEISTRSKFRPAYLEIYFGGKRFKPIAVDVGGKRVELVGKIDRVDTYGGKFIVIDYKTYSGADLSDKDLYYGGKLQLYIYADAIRENLDLEPAGVFYLPVYPAFIKEGESRYRFRGQLTDDTATLEDMDSSVTFDRNNQSVLPVQFDRSNKLSSKVHLDADGFIRRSEYARELAREGAKELGEGYIKPVPFENACGYCDFSEVCPYQGQNNRTAANLAQNAFDLSVDGEDGTLNENATDGAQGDNAADGAQNENAADGAQNENAAENTRKESKEKAQENKDGKAQNGEGTTIDVKGSVSGGKENE